jgi:hypothetical protein
LQFVRITDPRAHSLHALGNRRGEAMKKIDVGRTPAAEKSHRRERPDGGDAFIPDPSTAGRARANDPLAEQLAEEYLQSATTGEEAAPDAFDQTVDEEEGGPFVVSPASNEFADGEDLSNPRDAEAEPLPSPMRGVR